MKILTTTSTPLPLFLATVLFAFQTVALRAQEYRLPANGTADYYAGVGTLGNDAATNACAGPMGLPSAADLVIAAAPQVHPTLLTAGSPAVVQTTVRNTGTRRAGFSVLGYYLSADATLDPSDVLLAEAITTALAPGNALAISTELTLPAGTAAGTYHLLCVADYLNLVRESNDSNNSGARPLEVAPVAGHDHNTRRTSPLAALTGQTEARAGFDLSIAPNPVAAATPLRVQLSATEPQLGSELALYNELGQWVGGQKLCSGYLSQAELPTTGLAAGVYTLRLTGPSLHTTRRVVIK